CWRAEHNCRLVVFPELALTTFLPRWWMPDQREIDSFFEWEMPSAVTAPHFNEAQRLGIGFSALPRSSGKETSSVASIHGSWSKPGAASWATIPRPTSPAPASTSPGAHSSMWKRYFEVGDLGWGVWNALGGELGMCICNDRRWPSPTGQAAAQAL